VAPLTTLPVVLRACIGIGCVEETAQFAKDCFAISCPPLPKRLLCEFFSTQPTCLVPSAWSHQCPNPTAYHSAESLFWQRLTLVVPSSEIDWSLHDSFETSMSRAKRHSGSRGGGSGGLPSLKRWAGEVGFQDESKSLTRQRMNMSRLRREPKKHYGHNQREPDFLDLITLVCEIYHSYHGNLIPMQQFNRTWELEENAGHACIVTTRSITSPHQSPSDRGESKVSEEKVIVKRTKKPIFGTESSAIHTLINEFRIRSHPPLRGHPNIVDLKGIAWDFENSDEGEPIHLLVEEFAPHRALDTFWGVRDLVRMPLLVKANLCRDVAEGINALHDCGIAHGDIKPGNVLIFPNSKSTMGDKGRRFTAKLTDFGHSVCEFTKDPTLPIWTPMWSAPESQSRCSRGRVCTNPII